MNNNQIGRYVEETVKSLLIDSKYSDKVKDITYTKDSGIIYILFKNKTIVAIFLDNYNEYLNKKTAVLSAVLATIVSVIEEV